VTVKIPPLSIDLHTHIRGAISPKLIGQLSEKNDVYVPSDAANAISAQSYPDFETFLGFYDQIGRVIRKPEDLQLITADYLARCALEGTRYIELMLSPDHSEDNGLPIAAQFDAVAGGIADAKRTTGIEAALIVTAVRHRGPEAAIELAEKLSTIAHPIVRGFGLTGNELLFDVREFAGAFYVAKLGGLGCTAHAGEWGNARSVLRAIDELGLARVGHGLSIVNDPAILQECIDRETVFEVCLSSNLKLGRCANLSQHPIIAMMEAGCKVTLATDDPTYFGTTPAQEYQLAEEVFGFKKTELNLINMAAIDGAFCSNDLKDRLRSFL
jgi:adenosine deaminase